MSRPTTMTVRVSGTLSEFVAAIVGKGSAHENVSKDIRHLISRDKERAEREPFDRRKAEMNHAFAAPEESSKPLRVQEAASVRVSEISRHIRDRWGVAQAEIYVTGLFAAFEWIERRGVMSRPVTAGFRLAGYFFRYERHFVSGKRLAPGDIGIVTFLRERMHKIGRV